MLFAVDSTFFVIVPLLTPGLHPHSKAHLPAPFPPDSAIISYNTTLLSLCREICFPTLLKGHHLSPLICLWKSSLGVSCRRCPPLDFHKKFERYSCGSIIVSNEAYALGEKKFRLDLNKFGFFCAGVSVVNVRSYKRNVA